MTDLPQALRAALVPRFDVDRELGSGGMGVAYLARDRRLGRLVVIKAPRPDRVSSRDRSRFLRAARLLTRLNHPNVVTVFDAEDLAGVPYCVMQYLEGESLAQRLTRGPLPPAEAIRVGRDLLSALSAVHRAGVVHRDVTPSNVILEADRAVLTDFGLAVAVDGMEERVTEAGVAVGTPAYRAPEQAEGAEPAPAADVYSAALVLHEALTGRRWTGVSESRRADRGAAPRRVARVLARGLARNPKDRWQDGGQFLRGLERAISPRRWPLALGLAVLAGVILWRVWRPSPPRLFVDLLIEPLAGCPAVRQEAAAYLVHYLDWFPEWRVRQASSDERITFRWRLEGERRCASRPELVLSVYDSTATLVDRFTVRAADPLHLAGAAADSTVARLWPGLLPLYRALGGPERRAQAATIAYFKGEDAFGQDRWLAAENWYRQALAIDPGFVLAAWKLAVVRQWRRVPFEDDLRALYHDHAAALPELHRLLIQAALLPDVPARLALYSQAAARYPHDAEAQLMFANEMFVRGPLADFPLDSGIALMREAARRLPLRRQAPALDHQAWGHIRLGNSAAARSAIFQRLRIPSGAGGGEPSVAPFLVLAYLEHFHPTLGRLTRWWLFWGHDRDDVDALAEVHRLAISFDVPAAETGLGEIVSRYGGLPVVRASGFEARGLGLLAQGRASGALPLIDSAAMLFDSDQTRFEALAWRVLPPALGYDVIAASERRAGEKGLQSLARGGAMAAPALGVLAFAAFARGDTLAGRTLAGRIAPGSRDSSAGRWVRLLEAMELAATRGPAAALEHSEPLLAYDSTGLVGGPFLRTAIRLKRSQWWEAVGRPGEAERELRWYENTDFRGWPGGEAQASEVDAVFSSVARLRRGRLLLDAGQDDPGCRMLRRVRELWRAADPPLAPRIGEVNALLERCDR